MGVKAPVITKQWTSEFALGTRSGDPWPVLLRDASISGGSKEGINSSKTLGCLQLLKACRIWIKGGFFSFGSPFWTTGCLAPKYISVTSAHGIVSSSCWAAWVYRWVGWVVFTVCVPLISVFGLCRLVCVARWGEIHGIIEYPELVGTYTDWVQLLSSLVWREEKLEFERGWTMDLW